MQIVNQFFFNETCTRYASVWCQFSTTKIWSWNFRTSLISILPHLLRGPNTDSPSHEVRVKVMWVTDLCSSTLRLINPSHEVHLKAIQDAIPVSVYSVNYGWVAHSDQESVQKPDQVDTNSSKQWCRLILQRLQLSMKTEKKSSSQLCNVYRKFHLNVQFDANSPVFM